MKKCLIVLCSLLLIAGTLQAETVRLDPVVVTATRTGTPLSQVASSVTVITAEEIEAKQQPLVVDLLRSVPGITVSRSGGTGGVVSIFMRGTDNKHTLILVNGIELNDPSAVGAAANLTNMTTDNIERIEVVRGAQSVLYGSDAIGGVINIITKKGTGKPTGYVSVEGGSYNTWQEQAGISAGSDSSHFSLAISNSSSDGFSAANKNDGNTEKDGYKNTSISFNGGADLSEQFELNFGFQYATADYDYDATTDANNSQQTDELGSQIHGIFHLFDNRWKLKLGATYTSIGRDDDNESWGTSNFEGTKTKLEMQNTLQLDSNNILVFGAENETEQAENSYGQDAEATNNAIFLEDQLALGDFITTIGARYDNHEEFGGKTTWKIAPSYTFVATGTRVKGSLGTGFKAPTLYELYDPSNGNENLEAEQSLSYDIGIEQSLFSHRLIFDITWFKNDIEDYIEWVSTGGWSGIYQNGGDITTRGLETSVQIYPSDLFDLNLSYTYTDTKDTNGDSLLKRPRHKGNLSLNLYPDDEKQITLDLLYVGEQDDISETLDDYILVNLAGSHQITPNIKGFIRVDNLFDEDYEEVAGYGTAGLSAYAGVKLTF